MVITSKMRHIAAELQESLADRCLTERASLCVDSACLTFTDMNKEERCIWHRMAKENGLASMTEGCGILRPMHIFRFGRCKALQRALSSTPDTSLQTAFSKELWLSCHLEGGNFSDLSPEDIKHVCSRPEQISHELKELHRLRMQVRRLAMGIHRGLYEEAKSIIEHDPCVLHKIEESCYAYPIHLACARGDTQMAKYMLSVGGLDLSEVLDSRGNNLVELARAHGQYWCATRLEEFLEVQPIKPPAPRSQLPLSGSPNTSEDAATSNTVEVYRYERQRTPVEGNERRRRRGGKRGNGVHGSQLTYQEAQREKNRVLVVNREQIRLVVEKEKAGVINRQPHLKKRNRRAN